MQARRSDITHEAACLPSGYVEGDTEAGCGALAWPENAKWFVCAFLAFGACGPYAGAWMQERGLCMVGRGVFHRCV